MHIPQHRSQGSTHSALAGSVPMPSTRDTPTSSWRSGWMERVHRAPGCARNCRTAHGTAWWASGYTAKVGLGEKTYPDRDQLQLTFNILFKDIQRLFWKTRFKMHHLLMCHYFDHADPIRWQQTLIIRRLQEVHWNLSKTKTFLSHWPLVATDWHILIKYWLYDTLNLVEQK
jgi:hypothetical protein